MLDDEVALGPGKADLLAGIAEHGSLVDAAADLGMSYMRAWKLVGIMNACFREPLVKLRRGGAGHGGAELTREGKAVLELYQRMERESLAAFAPAWSELSRLLAGARARRPRAAPARSSRR
jgi:molybdate transport system regulatory protein